MNARNLEQFLALADTLHFGQASNACHISISALSRNIRSLEDELGVLLFSRDNRTVALTPEGEKFQTYARATTQGWQSIRNELADHSNELLGEVSMYCSVTAAYTILFDLLNNFRVTYPGIELKLHTGNPDLSITRIIEGREDITIAAHPKSLPRGVIFKPVTISPLLFIAPKEQSDNIPRDPDVPLSAPHGAKKWANVPMILSEGGLARNRIDAWFKTMGVTPRIYAQVAGFEAIVSMVSLGLGIGVVPKIVLDNSPMVNRIQVLKVKPELESYNIGLFTMKKNLKNRLVDAFWSLVE